MNTLRNAVLFAMLFPAVSLAADEEILLTIRNHSFEPAVLRVKANTKIKIVVQNQDATAEEFESHELNREKVIPGNGKAVIFVGPLRPGNYPFYGEFHADTARGQLVAE